MDLWNTTWRHALLLHTLQEWPHAPENRLRFPRFGWAPFSCKPPLRTQNDGASCLRVLLYYRDKCKQKRADGDEVEIARYNVRKDRAAYRQKAENVGKRGCPTRAQGVPQERKRREVWWHDGGSAREEKEPVFDRKRWGSLVACRWNRMRRKCGTKVVVNSKFC